MFGANEDECVVAVAIGVEHGYRVRSNTGAGRAPLSWKSLSAEVRKLLDQS